MTGAGAIEQTPRNWLCQAAGGAPLGESGEAASWGAWFG